MLKLLQLGRSVAAIFFVQFFFFFFFFFSNFESFPLFLQNSAVKKIIYLPIYTFYFTKVVISILSFG